MVLFIWADFSIPSGFVEFTKVIWQKIPTNIYWSIGFVVIFTTCIPYLFNLYGLSKIKPTTVSVFIYLQPLIAAVHALIVGSDTLNMVKVFATIFIFLGVYLVTKQLEEKHKV